MARIFKTGSTQIAETDATAELTIEQVQELLRPTYPEVAHATVRQRQEGENTIVEFLPQPGRKG